MTKERTTTLNVDEAFEAARKTHQVYAQDTLNITPIMFFIQAFKTFYGILLVDLDAERFDASRRFFDQFAKRVDELEANEDATDVWRLWEQGVLMVDNFDRQERSRVTPPTLSIDEMLAQGVGEYTIAKVYGFFDPYTGEPDVVAVRERRPWKPAPRKTKNPYGIVSSKEGTEETEPVLPKVTPKAAKAIEEGVKATVKTSLDAEILAGIAPRKIAAKYGVTPEDVKKRADELSAVKDNEAKA